MPVRELLKQLRSAAGEVSLLDRALRNTGELSKLTADMDPGQQRLRKKQREKQLQEMAQDSLSRRDALRAELDALMSRHYTTSEDKTILVQYYGWAMSDAEIAALLGLAAKTVQTHRRRWVLRVERGSL